ncbi:MAG: methyltransferase domain-containing protein [Candidatus Nealsonbacteria bacterium]
MIISNEKEIQALEEGGMSNKELEYWRQYSEFMMSKYRDAYINSPYFQEELRAINEFMEPKEKERWLDLGCGALPVSELLLTKKVDLELWAGDIILAPAEKKIEELGNPPVKLFYIDLTKKLKIPDNFFDGIGASKVLPYIPESQGEKGKEALRQIFKELFRILKPGGTLVWSGSIKNVSRFRGTLLALGYILNPYQWIKQRCFLPVFAAKVNEVFKPMVEKIKEGTYPVLSQEENEDIILSVGFENPEWRLTFGKQVVVNKVTKPL